jgi:ribosomal protein L10
MSLVTGVKKFKTYEKIHNYLVNFKQIILCEIKDLPADMIHKIRKQLRDINSEVVCGKAVNKNFIKNF